MGSFGVIFKYIYFAINHSGIDLCKLHVEAAELKKKRTYLQVNLHYFTSNSALCVA